MSNPTFNVFDTLVNKHSREIHAYLWRMLQDSEDADDALQDVFLRAFRAFPGLKDHSHLRAWLYKIATNVAYTQLKKRSIQAVRTTDLVEIPESDDVISKELLKMVLAAIQHLPYKQGATLLLRNYQGLSYVEIGEAIDCSPESARANYYQGLQKLRKQFAEVNV